MLSKLIAEGRPLLADGATGTNLIAAGLVSDDCAELWNEIHPDRIRALHQSFVDAGADIILTNSFGANRRRLDLRGLGARAKELSRLAAQNARAVADRAARPIVVAGSVGPTGDMLAPLGSSERGRSDGDFRRADRRPQKRRRRRRLDRNDVGARGGPRRCARGDRRRRALYRDRELRHGGLYDDGA